MNVGIIGAGSIAVSHANAVKNIDGLNLLKISASTRQNACNLAERFNAAASDTEELLQDSNIELVIVCSPTHLHKEHSILAMKNGKAVLCEKPFARTLADAEEMISAQKKYQTPLMIAHVLRFFPQYIKARELITKNLIGEITEANFFRLNSQPLGSKNWFKDIRISGGVILDLMIHDIDYVLWNWGNPIDFEVMKNPDFDESGFHYSELIFRYEKCSIKIVGSWCHESFSHFFLIKGMAADLYKPKKMDELIITYKDTNKHNPISLSDYEEPYTSQLRNFCRYAQGKSENPIEIRESFNTLEYALKALAKLSG